MNKKNVFIATLIAPFLAAIFLSIHIGVVFLFFGNEKDQQFTIKSGEGFASINARLARLNIIPDARLFHYWAKYQNAMTELKPGTYQLNKGLTIQEVLKTLRKGEVQLEKVLIREGLNMYEIADILVQESIITSKDEFIKLCKSQELIDRYVHASNQEAPSLEGYLYPETYFFSKNTPSSVVIEALLHQFQQQTEKLDFNQSDLSPYEVITLASIVEKETAQSEERAIIAGVYLNRLKKKMRLQADPTTIYGIWERFDGNLKKKHLLEKNEYNTYKMSGLPLGPIANPSKAAIEAVLNPAQHDYLFFVSKNDGFHDFSVTYKEHAKKVNYWQKYMYFKQLKQNKKK